MKINDEIREERILFAKCMIEEDTDWNFVCFTDESSFWLSRSQPRKGWSQDHSKTDTDDYQSIKIHYWGGITVRGALKIELFQENLNSVKYMQIIRKKKKELQSLYPNGCAWQQDNSSIHNSGASTKVLEQQFDSILDFSAYSPDLSPIENIWGWLKNEVSKNQPKSLSALKSSIRKNWKRITPAFLEPYFSSMSNRMQDLIDNDGFSIKC